MKIRSEQVNQNNTSANWPYDQERWLGIDDHDIIYLGTTIIARKIFYYCQLSGQYMGSIWSGVDRVPTNLKPFYGKVSLIGEV